MMNVRHTMRYRASVAAVIRSNVYVLLVAALALLSACGEEERPTTSNSVVIPKDAPDKESRNTTILLTDSNWTRAKLEVGHARQYVSRMETLLDSGVYVRFYDREGNLTATLVSDSARIDDRTKDMAAFGRVHVHSVAKRSVFDTDRLFFDNTRRRFHSDAPITSYDSLASNYIKGTGFESNESITEYKIYNISGRSSGIR